MSSSLLDPGRRVADGVADPTGPKLTAVADLADHLGHAMHALQRARAQMMARGSDGVIDWTTRVVLAKIVMTGPKRVSELADLTQSDASTVSRQVAAMVKEGLLVRQADPGDGRASLVVATEAGRAAMERYKTGRNRDFARVLDDWAPDDCTAFARMLERFTHDLVGATADGSITTDGSAAPAAKEH